MTDFLARLSKLEVDNIVTQSQGAFCCVLSRMGYYFPMPQAKKINFKR